MSSLGWIDFDEAERQRAQCIMALFQERGGLVSDGHGVALGSAQAAARPYTLGA